MQSLKSQAAGRLSSNRSCFFFPTLQEQREKNSFTPFNHLRPQIPELPSHYYCNATWVLIKRSVIGFCFRLRSSSSRVSLEIPDNILIIPSWHFLRLFEKLPSTPYSPVHNVQPLKKKWCIQWTVRRKGFIYYRREKKIYGGCQSVLFVWSVKGYQFHI